MISPTKNLSQIQPPETQFSANINKEKLIYLLLFASSKTPSPLLVNKNQLVALPTPENFEDLIVSTPLMRNFRQSIGYLSLHIDLSRIGRQNNI